jgi:hypothetical protein
MPVVSPRAIPHLNTFRGAGAEPRRAKAQRGLTCPADPTGVSPFPSAPFHDKYLETMFKYRELYAEDIAVITSLKWYSRSSHGKVVGG